MTNKQYLQFAKHYDATINRVGAIKTTKKLILENKKEAKSILELACGTGEILKAFSKHYEVYGLDLSKEMLRIARRKIPKAILYRRNMINFNLKKKFDIILCIGDSINHVLKFKDWEEIFSNVAGHLNKGGVFIFDINTIYKLETFVKSPPWIKNFGKNVLIMSIQKERKDLTNWNIKIFEKSAKGRYKLIEENIKEVSFPIKKIEKSLKECFNKIKIIDSKDGKPTEESSKIYFVCKK